jgi:membrane fusion protein, heavy metal efflux system
LNPVWVRVPVYVGSLETVDQNQGARVESFGNSHESRTARFVQGPPVGDPNAASTDLFYEMENGDGRFRIGEKVSVSLLQKQNAQGLIVPVASILYDIQGGTWLYIRKAPHVYLRQRVELRHIAGENALLARGPSAGTEVVTSGAAELFGTEFGGAK